MTPAERIALDRFAAVSTDRARRLRLLAEADDAIAVHLLRCPEGDAAELLAWQRQTYRLVLARHDAEVEANKANRSLTEAGNTWERAFAEGA